MPKKLGIEESFVLQAYLRDGAPLPTAARSWLIDLVDEHGTEKRISRRAKFTAIIGMHFWALRAKYGSGSDEACQTEVADHWGIKPGRVKTIGRRTRDWKKAGWEPEDLDAMIASLENEAQRHSGHI